MSTANRFRLWTIIIIVIALYLVARFGVGLYTDYLWFQHLGLESVMLTGIWARFAVGIGVAIPFAALFWVNTFIARWQSI